MLEIREARISDAPAMSRLLVELGYPDTEVFMPQKIQQLLAHPDAVLWVAEQHNEVIGLISLHFIPQVALAGDICRICYFCVAESARRAGVGKLLEERTEQLARARQCDRIEVHCHSRRTEAHRFYARQGYTENSKYLMKRLPAKSGAFL